MMDTGARPGLEERPVGARPESGRSVIAVRGVFWSGATIIGPLVVSALVFVLTSRVLSPSDFGVVALAGAVAAGVACLIPGGFGDALVQQDSVDAADLDSVFWLCTGAGAIAWLALLAVADPAARFFHAPLLATVLPVASARILADTAGVVPTAIVTRTMSFHLIAVRSLLASVVSALFAVALLLAGFGLWALVASLLASSFVSAAVMFHGADWRPRFRFHPGSIRALSAYGTYASGSRVMGYVGGQLDQAVVGFTLGTFDLGLYNFARRVFGIVSDVTTGALTTVAHPLFAGVKNDPARIRTGFLTATFLSSTIAFPCFVGLAVVADLLLATCFGTKWLGAVWPIRLLSGIGVIACIGVLQAGLINTLGHTRWWFLYQSATSLLNVPILFGLAPHGVTPMLAAIVAKTFLLWGFPVRMTLRLLHMRLGEYAAGFAPPLLGAVAMTVAIVVLRATGPSLAAPAELGADILLGGTVYVAILLATAWKRVTAVLALLRQAMARRSIS